MKRLTAEWVRKAEGDFVAVRKLRRGPGRAHDAVCFHCQQGAEKYLKGMLEELGLDIPRTHLLVPLCDALLPHHPALRRFRRGLHFLTRFAVGTRYPGDAASARQGRASVRWAGDVRDACRRALGLPRRPPL